jgi:integrase
MSAKRHSPLVNGEETTRWIVERGSATVKIYLTPHGANNYFTISYWMDGKRKRQVFPTFQKAKAEAAKKATQITNGDLGAAKLTNADSAAYLRAVALLKPLGVPLEFAASEYASAIKRLGAVSLSQAVDFYLSRHPVNMVPKMVKQVVDEILELKRSDKLSTRYIKQLEYDLTRFAGRFHGRLGDVHGLDVDAWLRDLNVGPRTRNNLRNSVRALFNFGIARKYLPKDHDEIDAVPVARDGDGEIEIYTPDEMRELMAVASKEHVPFLTISAFAGVRHAELQRLDWSHVNRKAEIIEIRAGTAKTASRRVIPILPNLAKWLKTYKSESGKVCNYANMVLQFVELTRRVNEKRRAAWAKANKVGADALKAADKIAVDRLAKLPRNQRRSRRTVMPGAETAVDEGWKPFVWKHNALRHSFISYRVAQTKNVAQVALEAGNSPQMIFQHYRELVQPDAAKEWFAITPGRSSTSPK